MHLSDLKNLHVTELVEMAIANEVDAELRARLLVKAGPKAEASTEADELEEV